LRSLRKILAIFAVNGFRLFQRPGGGGTEGSLTGS
jgi:hypothetical protein